MSGPPPSYDASYDRRGPPPPPPRGDPYGQQRGRHGGGSGGGGGGGHHPYRRGGGGGGGYRGHHRNNGPPPPRRRRNRPDLITFRSYEEEQEWLEDRRRKRQARGSSKFDQKPTPEQEQAQQAAAAAAAIIPTMGSATPTSMIAGMVPAASSQQTRHARRLYVGNLPPNITEAQVQETFHGAIQQALVNPDNSNPILNVYINHDRRFCFIEFTTVEMTTACMALDGLQVYGQTVKIKRPNDYNALTAPKVHPSQLPALDVSRLGIVSSTVQDGPNKIFIGGLHYHLQEAQVMELLAAFGKIKAFHLVKNSADAGANAGTSKGYCFVEYADPSVTPLAVQGLNGMDIGGGKSLTARLAGGRAAALPTPAVPLAAAAAAPTHNGAPMPPPNHTIVTGYDVEELVDAAMGKKAMPLAPQYMDPVTGQPLTRIVPMILVAAAAAPVPTSTFVAQPTRVLVLHNMVTDDDLATDEDYKGLVDEITEECRKYGNLSSVRVPRESTKKLVYLEYATVPDAENARRELHGRKFGDATVDTSFYSEQEYTKGNLE